MAKGKKTGGGSRKGKPNKTTADVKVIAQEYGQRAIDRLVKIMESDVQPAAAQVAAAKELLDRGYGKAVQAMKLDGGLEIRGIKRVIVDPAASNAKGIRTTS